jgi:hypothetical protein
MTVVAASVCGTALVVVALAGFMALRSAGALRAAAEAQNAAGLVFVGQLVELKDTLATLNATAQTIATAAEADTTHFAALTDRVGAEAEATRKAVTEAGPGIAQAAAGEISQRMGEMEVLVVEALADIQLSLAQAGKPAAAPGMTEPPAPKPAGEAGAGEGSAALSAATATIESAAGRLSAIADRLERLTASPVPAAQPGEAAATGKPPAKAPARATAPSRPAAQAPTRPTPNPFRFP